MLTGTTLAGIRLLVFLGREESGQPISPRKVAEILGESPTYLAKVAASLTRAGILKSHRGVTGGMTLAMKPKQITLLDIYQACQGKLIGDFCQEVPSDFRTCAFHRAMKELNEAVSTVLGHWTLEALIQNPYTLGTVDSEIPCRLAAVARNPLNGAVEKRTQYQEDEYHGNVL